MGRKEKFEDGLEINSNLSFYFYQSLILINFYQKQGENLPQFRVFIHAKIEHK